MLEVFQQFGFTMGCTATNTSVTTLCEDQDKELLKMKSEVEVSDTKGICSMYYKAATHFAEGYGLMMQVGLCSKGPYSTGTIVMEVPMGV